MTAKGAKRTGSGTAKQRLSQRARIAGFCGREPRSKQLPAREARGNVLYFSTSPEPLSPNSTGTQR